MTTLIDLDRFDDLYNLIRTCKLFQDIFKSIKHTNLIDQEAYNGCLNIIKWLHKNCENINLCTTDAMNNAAMYGHLEIVKWLHENRTEGYTTDAIDFAASDGYLDVVKFLYENRKDRKEGFTSLALTLATRNGYLDVVKYLCEECKMKFSKDAIKWANIYNRKNIIHYLLTIR